MGKDKTIDNGAKYITATSSTSEDCEHPNGWFFTVRLWIFKKEVFYCEDCNDLIPKKEIVSNT